MGSEEPVLQNLELKIPPLVLVVITGVMMWAFALVIPNPGFGFHGSGQIALFVASVGILMALLGVLQFRSTGTTIDPRIPDQSTSLVVKGVYRISRNPMYVGFLLVLLAWFIFLGKLSSAVMLPAFVLYLNRFQIEPEERYMQEKFGDNYRRYCEAVRRWI